MPKVDKYRPATWIRYRPELCNGCFAGCCTLPVQVSSEDLYHMGYLEFEEVNSPIRDIAVKLKRAGIVASYRSRSQTMRLRQRKNGDCLFLDSNRRCTIYDRRPTVCRKFPLNSARPGYCPGCPK